MRAAPPLIYGTAWKEEATARLVGLALEAGFRGIDTANQRRHYHEAGVGEAVRAASDRGRVAREDLFLQTKFTHLDGQDHRLPYDPKARIATQVEQSFASSLEHLGVEAIDSYVLHGPADPVGLAEEDWEAWRAMEDVQRDGRAKALGISNVNARQLEALHAGAAVKPAYVQNRCFTRPAADQAVRSFCASHGILYQGFSLLTGNRVMMGHPDVHAIAAAHGLTVPQVVFRHCLDRGMLVLTGTTSREHMAQDLAVMDLDLTSKERERLAALEH